MILNFDFHSDVPIFMQIRNQIVIGIAEGKLKPGDKLPNLETGRLHHYRQTQRCPCCFER